jgi:2-polyprenyl-3-methyl-5-hydroxy-6-metoxy-1,4-benzoquinol methylase
MAPVDSQACWCGATAWRVCFRTSRFGLIECGDCSCYRIDPRPAPARGEAAEFYTSYYEQTRELGTNGTRVQYRSRFWAVAQKYPPLRIPATSALDIGCGEGLLCGELAAAGWKSVSGLDISTSRILRARAAHPHVMFYDVPVERTGMAQESQDLIVMDNVIEHVPDPLGFIRSLKRWLRTGGRLVLITPNMRSGHFRLLGRRWTPELAPHVHDFLFTPRSICRLLDDAGYEVETSGSFHLSFYPLSTWLKRVVTDPKGAVWRAAMEFGGLAGRLVGQGEMLFAVGRRS